MGTRGTRCRFSRKAPQKLSCRVVARRSYSWNYICLIGLQPCKEVFCQAFFQKSGNRVPSRPSIPASPYSPRSIQNTTAEQLPTWAVINSSVAIIIPCHARYVNRNEKHFYSSICRFLYILCTTDFCTNILTSPLFCATIIYI